MSKSQPDARGELVKLAMKKRGKGGMAHVASMRAAKRLLGLKPATQEAAWMRPARKPKERKP